MVTEASVRDLIARYVAGSISAADLANALPDGGQLDDADETTANLVLRTMGYLSEYENGDLADHELRAALEPESAWRLEQSRFAFTVRITQRSEVRVRAGADTPPLVVPAT